MTLSYQNITVCLQLWPFDKPIQQLLRNILVYSQTRLLIYTQSLSFNYVCTIVFQKHKVGIMQSCNYMYM